MCMWPPVSPLMCWCDGGRRERSCAASGEKYDADVNGKVRGQADVWSGSPKSANGAKESTVIAVGTHSMLLVTSLLHQSAGIAESCNWVRVTCVSS